jgi:hypothetical protein
MIERTIRHLLGRGAARSPFGYGDDAGDVIDGRSNLDDPRNYAELVCGHFSAPWKPCRFCARARLGLSLVGLILVVGFPIVALAYVFWTIWRCLFDGRSRIAAARAAGYSPSA